MVAQDMAKVVAGVASRAVIRARPAIKVVVAVVVILSRVAIKARVATRAVSRGSTSATRYPNSALPFLAAVMEQVQSRYSGHKHISTIHDEQDQQEQQRQNTME
jgi:hypothetical protein